MVVARLFEILVILITFRQWREVQSRIDQQLFELVFCQMIPFAEVVLLTAIEYQRTEEEDQHKVAYL